MRDKDKSCMQLTVKLEHRLPHALLCLLAAQNACVPVCAGMYTVIWLSLVALAVVVRPVGNWHNCVAFTSRSTAGQAMRYVLMHLLRLFKLLQHFSVRAPSYLF